MNKILQRQFENGVIKLHHSEMNDNVATVARQPNTLIRHRTQELNYNLKHTPKNLDQRFAPLFVQNLVDPDIQAGRPWTTKKLRQQDLGTTACWRCIEYKIIS